jgi:hypothetical protein
VFVWLKNFVFVSNFSIFLSLRGEFTLGVELGYWTFCGNCCSPLLRAHYGARANAGLAEKF